MNLATWIILSAVAAALILALAVLRRNRRKGCSGCASCHSDACGNCPYSKTTN